MTVSVEQKTTYQLYTYFRSSCSARVLIAAKLKNIHLTQAYIDMGKEEHKGDSFKLLNPSGAVPLLVIRDADGEITMSQSIAILEYLEEVEAPDQVALLPPVTSPKDRAKVRELVGIITMDLFPPTNGRVAQMVREIRGEASDQVKFVQTIMATGFASYEGMLQGCSGKYSFGDSVTMADACLVPAVDMAQGYKCDLTPYPRVLAVYNELMKLNAFRDSSWRVQEDTPEQYRIAV